MQRKVVTVLFCDVVGSTALGESVDPEALRSLLARYFEEMKTVVERHGGTVEKFIGDAVMAVFGVPAVREDDALRAVRAAEEMRAALPALGIEGRIGVNTGEVVTGTNERLATGDAVNVAARLEQAAEPGEILLGEPTFALVRHAVVADAAEPLELKGKSVPVTTSPVLTPILPSIPSPGSAARISSAARTARSASSSRTIGTPKRAITASPMNFSTVPPCRSTIVFISPKYLASTLRSASGSTDSPSAVEPTTSQNSTVTTLRCTREAYGGAGGRARCSPGARGRRGSCAGFRRAASSTSSRSGSSSSRRTPSDSGGCDRP